MPFPISDMIGRLRNKVDAINNVKDSLTEDGTEYTNVLTQSPVIPFSETIFINHPTFTTGLNQLIYNLQNPIVTGLSGVNIFYNMNYTIGEFSTYIGSGYRIGSGLIPFAPWNTSTVIAYYQASTYSDFALGTYLSYAVASVESALQMGMFVSGISGVLVPNFRNTNDTIALLGTSPYDPGNIMVIADTLEITQELIAQKAAYDLMTYQRRIGAGNAIKIVDGDTQIDTSVNQKYLADLLKDLKADYLNTINWVLYNMSEGYSLRTINELSIVAGYAGTRSSRVGGFGGSWGTSNFSFPMDSLN